MAEVITYDVEGVEASGGGGSVDPKPGVMPGKIVLAEKRTERNDGQPANDIRVAVDLGGDYMWKFTYIGLGPESDWKLAEFIRALGLKDKGKLDLSKIKGTMIRVKLNPDTYEGEPTSKIGRIMKAHPDDVLPAATEKKEADDDDTDDELANNAGGEGYPNGYEPEREDPDGEVGSYDDWNDEDVAGEVEDRGLAVAGGRGKKRDKQIAALRADDENPLDGDPAGAGDDAATGDDDYDEWTVEDLEGEATERELDLPKKGRGPKAVPAYQQALIDLLRTDDEENPFDPNAS